MTKDRFYSERLEQVQPFEFNDKVAGVFDDMVSRSVPSYKEVHKIQLDVVDYHFKPGDRIVDLGCSTGMSFQILDKYLEKHDVSFIGVDNSQPMLDKAAQKWENSERKPEWICSSLEDFAMPDSGIVLMNYTLQFLPPKKRDQLLKNIYASLRPGGVLFLSEKCHALDPKQESLWTDLYYDFKRRNGYSDLEISQKREALMESLRPWTVEENLSHLKAAGFEHVFSIFQHFQFFSLVAIKA